MGSHDYTLDNGGNHPPDYVSGSAPRTRLTS